MMEFVSWDDELFPTEWKDIKFMFQSTNQKKSPVLEDRFVLVGGAITILKNMSLSMGRMTSHI
jgi:hypothetical protein